MSDNVNHPTHYNMGSIEVIEVIDDWGLGFELGNAVKYIGRAGHKGKKTEDLRKAIWYIEREIAKTEHKMEANTKMDALGVLRTKDEFCEKCRFKIEPGCEIPEGKCKAWNLAQECIAEYDRLNSANESKRRISFAEWQDATFPNMVNVMRPCAFVKMECPEYAFVNGTMMNDCQMCARMTPIPDDVADALGIRQNETEEIRYNA